MAHVLTHRGNIRHRDRADDYEIRARADEVLQRERFGGFNFGAAFYGWIVATGIGVLLAAILGAAGTAIGLSSLNGDVSNITSDTAQTIGLAGGILLLVALAISYYAGGYVAGRMSRFDGARQGLGVWIIGIVLALIIGALAAIFGSQYNILQGLNLPHVPIKGETLTTGGLITSLIAIAITFLAAISGGKMGERYHRKIDRISAAD